MVDILLRAPVQPRVGLYGLFLYQNENMVIMVFGALVRNATIVIVVIVVIANIPAIRTHIFANLGFCESGTGNIFLILFFSSLYLLMM